MLNYERIIEESRTFANNHLQINSFGSGDLWETVQRDKLQAFNYPLLWMQDNGSSVQDKAVFFNFNIFAIDQVLNGEENENFVKSNMHQILLDYLAYFKQVVLTDVDGNRIYFDLQTSATLTSFTERFNDELTGWTITVSFKTPFKYDKCNIPGVSPAPTPIKGLLYWQMDFYETDEISYIPASAFNIGDLTALESSSNVGDITISTDDITYIPFTLPFTPAAGTNYYFKRSEATVTGQYIIRGTYE